MFMKIKKINHLLEKKEYTINNNNSKSLKNTTYNEH